MNSSTSTLSFLILSIEPAPKIQLGQDEGVVSIRPRVRANRKVQNAVYAYIRAIRALGRTEINTDEIAAALSLPVSEVNSAVSALKKKGVKKLNG
jgi:hypothetical protein